MNRIGIISIGLLLCLTLFTQEIDLLVQSYLPEEIADKIKLFKEELSKGIKGLGQWGF